MEIFLVILFTIVFVRIFLILNKLEERLNSEPVQENTNNSKHKKPRYSGYNGGYTEIVVCKSCGLTGLYVDYHPVHPCPDCGDKLKEMIGFFDYNREEWAIKHD